METKQRTPVIWLRGLECTCCTEAFIRSAHPLTKDVVLSMISLACDDTLMAAAGHQAKAILEETIKKHKGHYILAVEGNPPLNEGGMFCIQSGKPFIDKLKHAAEGAKAITSLGAPARYAAACRPPNRTRLRPRRSTRTSATSRSSKCRAARSPTAQPPSSWLWCDRSAPTTGHAGQPRGAAGGDVRAHLPHPHGRAAGRAPGVQVQAVGFEDLPARLGLLFSLFGTAHRITARRAVGTSGLKRLAANLEADPGFAARPTWACQPAETGCWTRVSHTGTGPGPHNAWMRGMVRIAELITLAQAGSPLRLASGMLALSDRHGVAWSEMSRGLLIYAVRLARRSGTWVVDSCRVIAPTEWNFHPHGGLALALQARGLAMDTVRAAVAAMDACVEVSLPAAGAGAAHA